VNEGPSLVICMGVSGCGKSTLARKLAAELGFEFLEADNFHPARNRAWMAAGRPLDDSMRAPWIQAICDYLDGGPGPRPEPGMGMGWVMACSCLRRAHRQRFRELGYRTRFLQLAADRDVLAARMQGRRGHYMPVDLLDSQLRDLQSTAGEPDIIQLDAGPPPDAVLAAALAGLADFLQGARA